MRSATFVAGLALAAFAFACSSSVLADEESEALREYDDRVEASVDKALAWLSQARKENGEYPGQYGNTGAVPALIGMAYLSAGYTPGHGPYGEEIDKCLDRVLESEKEKDGKPTGYFVRTGEDKMYGHCICTLFMSEVSGMVDAERQAKLEPALARALALILQAQRIEKEEQYRGGWRYEPESRDADLSLTGWAIMALRSARLNGAQVPDDSIAKSVEFILRCQPKESKGEKGYAYQPYQNGKPAMTGVSILCLALSGQHGSEELPRAADWLIQRKVNDHWGGEHFYYMNYYCTQAMFQMGGDYWTDWAKQFYENAFEHQRDDGSWGDAFPTAMTVLALTVSYRQLPVYQR